MTHQIRIVILACVAFAALAGADGIRPSGNTGTGFYVSDGKIYDPTNKEFLAMGVNAGCFWYNYAQVHYNSVPLIDQEEFNLVRIVSVTPSYGYGWSTSTDEKRKFVGMLVDKGIVPMLEMHDATCSANKLQNILDYWYTSEMVQLAKDYEKTLWLNIANEHDFSSAKEWRDTYVTVIQTLRNKGVKNLICLDQDAFCGQNPRSALQYCQDILAADPQHNVVFSIHMYAFWRNAGSSDVGTWNDKGLGTPWDISVELQKLADAKVPTIIGEFNWDTPANGLCPFNPRNLIQKCESLGIGWVFWAWYDQGDNSLNIVTDITNPTTLTPAGNWIVPHCQANAKRANFGAPTIAIKRPAKAVLPAKSSSRYYRIDGTVCEGPALRSRVQTAPGVYIRTGNLGNTARRIFVAQ